MITTLRGLVWLFAFSIALAHPVHGEEARLQQLNQQVSTLYAQGDYARASVVAQEALLLVEAAHGPDHPEVATSLSNLAELYRAQGQYARAVPLCERALAIYERALGPDHPFAGTSLNNLGLLFSAQGRHAEAAPLYTRALAIREAALGPNHPDVAASLNNLALHLLGQGRYAEAAPLYERALAIWERAFGRDSAEVATALNNLAELHLATGRYADAEAMYTRALAVAEAALGPDHPDVAGSLNNLAQFLQSQGRYAQAEPLLQRALAIWEKALGLDHPDVATSLDNLAGLYQAQRQFALAAPLHLRALAIREGALGPRHPDVAISLNNLAEIHQAKGQYAEAAPLLERAVAIQEVALGPHHPNVAFTLNNLAGIYLRQGQLTQAGHLYTRALAIRESALGPDHPDVATSLMNLAALHQRQGQYTQAAPMYERALTIRETALGRDHPDIAISLNYLAELHRARGQYAQALALSRRASTIYRQRIIAGGASDSTSQEAARNQDGFARHISLLARNPGQDPGAAIADESLQVAQLAQASGTAAAVARMAARFAQRNDPLASLIRRKQDAADRARRGESHLVIAAGKPPERRNAAREQQLRDDIARAHTEVLTVESELAQRYPEYHELVRPEPVSVNEVRALLRTGEAMVVHSIGTESFAWVIRPDGATFVQLQVTHSDVAPRIASARAQMEHDNDDQALADVLFELYQGLFAPLEPYLAGVNHVMLVNDGPLQSLPFSMLVTARPPAIDDVADFGKLQWLAERHAFSILPAVSSIQALRRFAANSVPAEQPFIGFGDPAIGGGDGAGKARRSTLDMADVFRDLASAPGESTPIGAYPDQIADVAVIRQQPALSESAAELRAIANVLGAGERALWLRQSATEANVRQLDLSGFRTVAFATHGVMSGQVSGAGEPGLLLTPPKQGTVQDDGYLSASEVAQLKLNADWVILSACNTAAADGTPGAEGLSGLAKAFFHAGARSLLVSHWSVVSDATVLLTTAMLTEFVANPQQGKAEAQRKAMLALMHTPGHPEYAHPLYWAPFSIAGEGGAAAP